MTIDGQPDQQRHSRAGTAVLITVCALPLVLLAGVVACFAFAARAIGDFDFNVGDAGHQRHLAAVPVDPKACPYLVPVRADAADLTELWNQELGNKIPADEFRAAIGPRLLHFEMVLVAARSHVPASVARKIDAVVWDVESGRASIARDDAMTVVFSTPMTNGLRALADVSDLVGTACGEPLYTGFAF